MSPYRAQRRAAWAMVAGVVAIAALILSVWLVGAKSKADLRAAQNQAITAQTAQLRSGCARAVARDFEAWGTNHDLAAFAHDAAKARRAEGKIALARRYDARAKSAELRMGRIHQRLPARDDPATVAEFCRVLYSTPAH